MSEFPPVMNITPITGLVRLEEHLQVILEAPDKDLDNRLIDEVQLQLTERNMQIAMPKLLPSLTKILPMYQQNAESLTNLTIKLLHPIEFMQALDIASEQNLLLALQSPCPSTVLLGISIISKASRSPSHTAILSTMKPLVSSLIQTWLSSPEVEVGEAATKVLADLLEVDCDCRNELSSDLTSRLGDLNMVSDMPLGQGLLWRRIFQDQDIYDLLFTLCCPSTIGTDQCRVDKRQKSLAQGRLLRILPRMAVLNFQMITISHFPSIEQKYMAQCHGILYFAAIEMVNKKDLLMHITLIIFFGELLSMMSRTNLSPSSLEYLSFLVKKAVSDDSSLKESLETTASDPETTPELMGLLTKFSAA